MKVRGGPVMECCRDVVTGTSTSEEVGSGVLDLLKFIEEIGRCAVKDAVAVVDARFDEGMNEGFSCRQREKGAKAGDVLEVVESHFCNYFNVLGEGEFIHKENSKVPAVI